MPVNPEGSFQQPLELFGGLNKDVSPIDLPEGLSPSCQDVAFLPGSVFTRPALQKLYAEVAPPSVPINYLGTFSRFNGQPMNVMMDGAGNLYYEDVVAAPGVIFPNVFGTVSPGSLCKSDNGDNKHWMAFSDGLKGIDIPRSFDGVNFNRISQSGPGAPPTVADFATAFNIVASAGGLLQNITGAISAISFLSGTLGSVATPTTQGVQVGDSIQISGTVNFNGTYPIVNLAAGVIYFSGCPNAATEAAGTVTYPLTTVNLTAATLSGLQAGLMVTIAGAGVAGYNGTWQVRVPGVAIPTATFQVMIPTFGLGASGNGTATVTGGTFGALTAGVHKVAVSFVLQSGYITRPSPITSWVSANGVVLVQNIPTPFVGGNPGKVVGRILHFTAAGGADFYYIAASLANGGTMVTDNTTTIALLAFSDAALLAGVPIGVKGNNLFSLDTLGPCLGLRFYKNRLVAWGELNKIPNMLNLDFDGGAGMGPGGSSIPLGWIPDPALTGGTVILSPYWFGGWQLTGDGAAAKRGHIFQAAFQDEFGVSIAQARTFYSVRCWAKASAAGLTGNLTFAFSSVSAVFSSSGNIPANSISTVGGWVKVDLPGVIPAVVPADLVFEVYCTGVNNGATIKIDEVMPYPTAEPVLLSQLSISYLNNPESFDLVNGLVIPEFPEQQIMDCWEERDIFYVAKSDLGNVHGSLHSTQDNGSTEPEGWTVQQISKAIGLISSRGSDVGEDFSFLADIGGLYMFNGGEPLKASQEIQTIWDSINPAGYQNVWMKNDRVARRLYIGLPTSEGTAPNVLAVMDYREMKGFSEIAYGDPVHISYTGRVLSTDLSRKWTIWNIKANCGAILERPNNARSMVFGGAGGASLSTGGFRNAYTLNSAKYQDDDYGQIFSFYTTYFFMTPQIHQQAQMLGLNLYDYLRMRIGGIGTVQLTFYGNDLSNAWPLPPTFPLPAISVADAELGLNVQTERIAVGFQVFPSNPGVSIDAAFLLQKLVVSGKKAAWAPVRGVF